MCQQPQPVHMPRTVHVGSETECADEYVYVRLVYYIMLKVYVTKQIIKHKITAAATCMRVTERVRKGGGPDVLTNMCICDSSVI